MKVLLRNKMSPVHLIPCDTLSLTYTDPHGVKTEVCRKTVDRHMVVDEGIIFELDEKELKTLGLKDAIGGLFGKSK